MNSWHSYPSIYNIGHKAVQPLLDKEVIAEEKVDGSQLSFGRFGDEIKIRSKGREFPIDAPDGMFQRAADVVKELKDKLHDGWTYRGEYLNKPHHNTLTYGRTPHWCIIIFDVSTGDNEFLPYEEKAKEASRLGLEVVPLLYRGKLDLERFKELLDKDSYLGNCKIEGVVIKPINYDLFGIDKKVLLAKYVSEAFKEKHNMEWKLGNPSRSDIVALISEALKTEARWNKAIQHLREVGKITDSPKDIGPLMKEIQADLEKEVKEEVAEKLVNYFWPTVVRGAMRGFPDWYKKRLLEQAFENKPSLQEQMERLGTDSPHFATLLPNTNNINTPSMLNE